MAHLTISTARFGSSPIEGEGDSPLSGMCDRGWYEVPVARLSPPSSPRRIENAKPFPSIQELSNHVLPRYSIEFDKVLSYPQSLKDLIFQYVESSAEDRASEVRHLVKCCFESFSMVGRDSIGSPVYKNIQVPGEAQNLTRRYISALRNKNNHQLSLTAIGYPSQEQFEEVLYSRIRQYVFQRDNKKQSDLLHTILSRPEPKIVIFGSDCFSADRLISNFEGHFTKRENEIESIKSDLTKLSLLELTDSNKK